jgi:hypothetical protein
MSSVKRRKKEQDPNEDTDTHNVGNESLNDVTQDVNGETMSDEEKVAKKIRKAMRRIGKHLRMDHEDEIPVMPNGFEFPSKEDVMSLGKKQKETFFDEAAACSEKIVTLTARILDAFGNKKKKSSSAAARAAVKGFEQAELWRQVSGFSRHCCSKALRAMHETEEAAATKEEDEGTDGDDDTDDDDLGADVGGDEAADVEEDDGAPSRRTEVRCAGEWAAHAGRARECGAKWIKRTAIPQRVRAESGGVGSTNFLLTNSRKTKSRACGFPSLRKAVSLREWVSAP